MTQLLEEAKTPAYLNFGKHGFHIVGREIMFATKIESKISRYLCCATVSLNKGTVQRKKQHRGSWP